MGLLTFDPIEKQPENGVCVVRAQGDGSITIPIVQTIDGVKTPRPEEDVDADIIKAYKDLEEKEQKRLDEIAAQQQINDAIDTNFSTLFQKYSVSKTLDENGNIVDAS